MSGGAPKGPRMATLERRNKKRETKDPEFKQKQHKLSQSFFPLVVWTRGNSLTHAGTPACSTQTVSAAPTADTLPTPLTPLFRVASLPAAPAATPLPKPLTPALGPASLPAAPDEIMQDTRAVIPPTSTQSGGSCHLQQHNPPDRPFIIIIDYAPKNRAPRLLRRTDMCAVAMLLELGLHSVNVRKLISATIPRGYYFPQNTASEV